jgi:hypothetical protein
VRKFTGRRRNASQGLRFWRQKTFSNDFTTKIHQMKKVNQPSIPPPTLQTLINGWKLNKEVLSSRMKMPVSTFKNKYNETNGKYRFTDAEKEQLLTILRELATDIELIAGVTFNSALAGIVNKAV